MIRSSLAHPGILRDAGDTPGILQRAGRKRAAPATPLSLTACRSGPGSGALLPALPVAPGPLGGCGQGWTGASRAASFFLPRSESAPRIPGPSPAVPCAARWGVRDGPRESRCVPRRPHRAVLCVCVCPVQAYLRKTIIWLVVGRLNTVTKHSKKTWSFYYRDCKKVPDWHAANSKESSTIEGKCECRGSSGCFSLHPENAFNAPVIVFDGQCLLWSNVCSLFLWCLASLLLFPASPLPPG